MDMVQFSFPLSEEQKKEKEKLVKKLLEEPYIEQWQQIHHVDDQYIYDHSGRFKDYVEVMKKCEQCQGIEFCTQPMKGNRLELYLDGMLQNRITPCKYLSKQQQIYAHMKQYREMDMPKSYLLVDLAKLNLTNESMEYKSVVMKVLQTIMDNDTTKGLYLWGKPGVGKSYLSAGICNYYAKKNKKVAFVNVPKLISDLKMMFHDSVAMEDKLRRIANVDVLVLDDIGGESVTAWSRDDILLPLLDQRMERKKVTFFTSNYRMQELKEKLAVANGKQMEPMAAERVLERISALSCENFIKGNSRRK